MNNFLMRMASMTTRKAIFFGLIATGVWYSLMFNDGSQLQTRLQKIDQDLQAERAKERESDAALKEIAAVQASLGNLSDQFRTVSAQLPTDIQMAEIIRTVDKVSQATGLTVKGKEPRTSIKQDMIEILPLRVSAEGTFAEITSFFYYLSTIERIVRIKSFKMNAPVEFRRNQRLNLEADIVSYKFVPPEGPKR